MASKEQRRASSKSFKDKMATLVLLTRSGLQDYYPYFETVGIKMFDVHAHPTDAQVEQMLLDVEKGSGITFVQEVRVKLWKALRYQWFRGPGHETPFIDRQRMPAIALPKTGAEENLRERYKEVDWHIPLADIDPDRQRQFIRRTRPSNEPAFRGPARSTQQYEVYKRKNDLFYEFKDIERCIAEWQNRNPRTMYREDPREHVFKLRLRSAEEVAAAALAQLHSGCSFCRWLRPNVTESKFQRLLYKCQWQLESISDFRTETDEVRIDLGEAVVGNQWNLGSGKKPRKKRSSRPPGEGGRRKRRDDHDATLELWTRSAEKAGAQAGSAEDEAEQLNSLDPLAAMHKSIQESYDRLPKATVDLRHRGGNRMVAFAGRIGLPKGHEDTLCVRLSSLRDDDDLGRGPPAVSIGLPTRSRSVSSRPPGSKASGSSPER